MVEQLKHHINTVLLKTLHIYIYIYNRFCLVRALAEYKQIMFVVVKATNSKGNYEILTMLGESGIHIKILYAVIIDVLKIIESIFFMEYSGVDKFDILHINPGAEEEVIKIMNHFKTEFFKDKKDLRYK